MTEDIHQHVPTPVLFALQQFCKGALKKPNTLFNIQNNNENDQEP